MNRLAFAALWLLAFSIPWQNSVVLPGVGTLSRAIGAAAVGLGLLALVIAGSVRRIRAFHVLALAFAIWSALSLSWSINVGTSLGRAVTFAQLAILTVVVWQYARTEVRQTALMQAYVLGAYVVAIGTLMSYATGLGIEGRYASEGFNPNDASCILALGVPIAWRLTVSSARGQALLNACYLPIAVVAALLTGSRGGFLALLIGLTIIPLSLRQLSPKARFGLSLLATGALVAAFLIVPQQLLERIGTTGQAVAEGDFTGRIAIWEAGVQVFVEHPVLGVGAGTYSEAVEPMLGKASLAHQTFLSVLVEEGSIGLALYGAMMIAALWPIHRMRGAQRQFWAVLALTLFVGLLPRAWDYAKPSWLLLALAVAQSPGLQRRASAIGQDLQAMPGARPSAWHTAVASRTVR